MNLIASQQGSQSLAPIQPMLTEVGYESSFPESALFTGLWSTIVWWLSKILLGAALYRVIKILFELYWSENKIKTLTGYKVRAFAIFNTVMYVQLGPTILNILLVLGIFISNGNFLEDAITVMKDDPSANTLEQDEKYVLSSNSAAQMNIATAANVTMNAQFSYNFTNMIRTPGLFGGSMTKDEAIDATLKFNKLNFKLDSSLEGNADVTSKLSNIINVYRSGRKYTIFKDDSGYDSDLRDAFGYLANYGTVTVGSNGSSFEQQSNESANDGTVFKSLRNIQDQSSQLLGPKRKAWIETVKAEYLKSMESSDFVSSDLKINTDIRSTSAKSIKSIVENNLNLADAGLKNPASYDIVNSYAYANAFSGFLGHDMTPDGQSLTEQNDYITQNISLMIRNAYCTDNWKKYTKEREVIKKFNALAGETPVKNIIYKNILVTMVCGNLNGETHQIDILGFEDKAMLGKEMKKALATKLAIDAVNASVYLGGKDSLMADKGKQAALNYSILIKLKMGMIGAGLADVEYSNYQNAKVLKKQTLNSNLFFNYANAGVDHDNYIIKEQLLGSRDIDLSDAAYGKFTDDYPVLKTYFNNLTIAPVANITPSSLTQTSGIDDLFDIQGKLLSALGQNGDGMKLLGRLPLKLTPREGAKLCDATPANCEANPRIIFEAGLRLKGDEDIEYGYTILAGSAAFDLIIESKDALGGVIKTVTAGFGMKRLSPIINFAYNTSSMLLLALAYGGKLFFNTLKPVGYIMLGEGYFCKYFLSLMKVMIMIGILIPVSWTFAIIKYILAPYYLLTSNLAGTEEKAATSLKNLYNNLLKLLLAFIVFSIIWRIGNFFLMNFDPAWLIRSILLMGDDSFISQLIMSVVASGAMVFYAINQLKQISIKHEETMAVLTQTQDSYEDSAVQQLKEIAMNPRVMDLVRQGVEGAASKAKGAARDKIREDRRKKEGLRKQFEDVVPQGSDGNTRRS
ncbi:hypothetical protein [Pseudomonas coronafaciens]|uniref:hypothetical protein n=1 Tax=Pseudomonas coronafaciens TaxID=53409 RepID=UPI0037BCA847